MDLPLDWGMTDARIKNNEDRGLGIFANGPPNYAQNGRNIQK